jgi:ATP-dependent RNA circularization protein (DNA/RNA ligase family)
MTEGFFKFPSTPHLAAPANIDIRRDKLMSKPEREEFLRHELIIEEKVDGANLGISFDSNADILLQNRGSCLQFPASGQWKKLEKWFTPKIEILFESLMDRYILFGEWCYARHSVYYNCLPDWFLGFDIYDSQEKRFLSSALRDKFFQKMHIYQVPVIAEGRYDLFSLKMLISESKLGNQMAEGIYLRFDDKEWLTQRAKLVHPAFIQSTGQHWSRSNIVPNKRANVPTLRGSDYALNNL